MSDRHDYLRIAQAGWPDDCSCFAMYSLIQEARNRQCFPIRMPGISLARAILIAVFAWTPRREPASAGLMSGSNVTGGASVAASELETQKTLLLVLRGVFKEELRF
jgi:hypothetical protein